MSIFYFKTKDDVIYELSATTNVSVKSPAVVTKSPVESGKSIVDNFYLDNQTVDFSGIITEVQAIRLGEITEFNTRTAGQFGSELWIDEVRQLRLKKELVSVYVDLLTPIPNCVITQFDIDKTKNEGFGGWLCKMSFQEVDISERSRLVVVPEAKEEVKDETDPKAKTSSNNTKRVELSQSILVNSARVVGL